MDIEKLKKRVKEPVNFVYFRDGALWYQACDGWIFPVPVEETMNKQGGSPTFNATEKGMYLMRWMRKYSNQQESLQAEGINTISPGS